MHKGVSYLRLEITMADAFPMEDVEPLQNLACYLSSILPGFFAVRFHISAEVAVFDLLHREEYVSCGFKPSQELHKQVVILRLLRKFYAPSF